MKFFIILLLTFISYNNKLSNKNKRKINYKSKYHKLIRKLVDPVIV